MIFIFFVFILLTIRFICFLHSLTSIFLAFFDLNLGQVVLIGELLHHVRNTVLNVGEHASEHDF